MLCQACFYNLGFIESQHIHCQRIPNIDEYVYKWSTLCWAAADVMLLLLTPNFLSWVDEQKNKIYSNLWSQNGEAPCKTIIKVIISIISDEFQAFFKHYYSFMKKYFQICTWLTFVPTTQSWSCFPLSDVKTNQVLWSFHLLVRQNTQSL